MQTRVAENVAVLKSDVDLKDHWYCITDRVERRRRQSRLEQAMPSVVVSYGYKAPALVNEKGSQTL